MQSFFEKIEWSPSIGDPSLMGWLTVAAYFLCAWQSFKVHQSGERIFQQLIVRQKRFWLATACVMLALGINKQLDLQTFFTATARYMAWQQGWYEERQTYQRIFIATIGCAGVLVFSFLAVMYYKVLRYHAFAIAGLAFLMVFVFVRATSFHNVDAFLGAQWLGLRMNWLLELGGIGLVYWNTRKLMRTKKPLIDGSQFAR